MSKLAYILLGSNINPKRNMRLALDLLQDKFIVKRISKIYETKPILKTDVDNYLNACVEILTDKDPISIKYDYLRKIEAELGRVRTEDKFKPRVIDLDLILIEDVIFKDEEANLELPDPEILQYAHIAIPLADLIPDYPYPSEGITIKHIANRLRDKSDLSHVEL